MRVGLVPCHSYPKRVALCLLFKVWGVFHRYPSLGRSWALTFFPPHTPRPTKVQLSVNAFSLELNQQMSSNRSNFECWAYLSEFLSSRGFWCTRFLSLLFTINNRKLFNTYKNSCESISSFSPCDFSLLICFFFLFIFGQCCHCHHSRTLESLILFFTLCLVKQRLNWNIS